jgi:hypothetical protein
MTKIKIRRSEILGIADFEAAAATHAVEMKSWRAHMRKVKEDEDNPPDDPMQKHWKYEKPHAHPVVERAVDENDEANFQIVEDGPTEEQKLRYAKDVLLHRLENAEAVALARIVPIGKRRKFNILEQDILMADHERRQAAIAKISDANQKWSAEMGKRSFVDKIAEKIGAKSLPSPPDYVDVEAKVVEGRPKDHATHLDAQAQRRADTEAIQRKVADLAEQIEDLTADTIATFVIPEL